MLSGAHSGTDGCGCMGSSRDPTLTDGSFMSNCTCAQVHHTPGRTWLFQYSGLRRAMKEVNLIE